MGRWSIFLMQLTSPCLGQPRRATRIYIYATDSGPDYRNADLAVDGNPINDISCALKDDRDFHPWWKVHLEFPVWVTRIEFTNRNHLGRIGTYITQTRDNLAAVKVVQGTVCGIWKTVEIPTGHATIYGLLISLEWQPESHFCSRTCLVALRFCAEKCMNASVRVQFFQRKIETINITASHVLLWSRICFLYEQQHRDNCWWITNSKQKL